MVRRIHRYPFLVQKANAPPPDPQAPQATTHIQITHVPLKQQQQHHLSNSYLTGVTLPLFLRSKTFPNMPSSFLSISPSRLFSSLNKDFATG